MANVLVTGPANIYVSLPSATWAHSGTGVPSPLAGGEAVYFLGTGEQAPMININTEYERVVNDIGGGAMPIESTYQGKNGQVSCVLNVWNESVMAALDNVPTQSDSLRGIDAATDIGTAMILEGGTFHVFVHFPYSAAKSYGALYNMPAGYHFFAAKLLPCEIRPGTKAKKRVFAVECDRVYNPANGKFYLYNHTMFSGITAVPPAGPTGATGQVVPATS